MHGFSVLNRVVRMVTTGRWKVNVDFRDIGCRDQVRHISSHTSKTKQVNVAVTLLTCIQEVLGLNLGVGTNYPD
jgi:hypothetical protein